MEERQGQRHDRIAVGGYNVGVVDMDDVDAGGPDFEISIVQKMLSAVTGSVLTSLLVTPLDVVRVRLQSQQQGPSSQPPNLNNLSRTSFNKLPSNLGVTACCREVFWANNNAAFCMVDGAGLATPVAGPTAVGECAVEESQRKNFTSTWDGLRKIARNEGVTTLWRGLSPTLVMAVPANVIYFAGYDWLRMSKKSPMFGRVDDAYAPLVAGSVARIFAALAVGPIELVRTRMQAIRSESAAANFKETLDSVRHMVGTEGYRSLWRGLTLTLWRDVPFSAFYWWGYEGIRNTITDARHRAKGAEPTITRHRYRLMLREDQSSASTLVDSFAAGAMSGAIASILTMPFDVGKTRQQVYQNDALEKGDRVAQTSKNLRPEERSMPRYLWHIFKTEGTAGLFRGWIPRTLKVAPACAIMISTYELGKKMAADMGKTKQED